ncbi:MAG TPA: 16S rRNA (guanine(966)-N(2))-methyltransferase RsmD [Lachnospiraceae bacterium]|nr:16S rRNA (guanine(966)-N(2))-methyltransferase RsmD [Lachnospiraceae bacterium]
MRVIAGKAKGRVLLAPKGVDTRPITAMIKEALFNIWQVQITGARFLDLFAGSGSMGIEALSRGAENVVFVEQGRKAIDTIKKNLTVCKFSSGYEIYQDDVFRRIKWLNENGYKFDIIYLDPPFTVDEIFLSVMEALANTEILSENGTIAIRTRKEKEMPDMIGKLEKFKVKIYGISGVHFYTGNHDINT